MHRKGKETNAAETCQLGTPHWRLSRGEAEEKRRVGIVVAGGRALEYSRSLPIVLCQPKLTVLGLLDFDRKCDCYDRNKK